MGPTGWAWRRWSAEPPASPLRSEPWGGPTPSPADTYRNVIAVFGPDTDERVVVGAHYDAAGELPGADDNASAVAGLIELGRLLGQTPQTLKVELVAFTLEEPKTMDGLGLSRSKYGGSAVHAKSLPEQAAAVRVVLNMGMIGYFSDEESSQEYPSSIVGLFYPSRGNFINLVGKLGQGGVLRRVKAAMTATSSLPVDSMSAPAWVEGIDYSDHTNYWNAGYDAVMINDTGCYRNRSYHTAEDTWDRLDYDRMAMVVQGVYAAVSGFSR
jgi:Zn-dependent M28 family amino/carboxypeptidase